MAAGPDLQRMITRIWRLVETCEPPTTGMSLRLVPRDREVSDQKSFTSVSDRLREHCGRRRREPPHANRRAGRTGGRRSWLLRALSRPGCRTSETASRLPSTDGAGKVQRATFRGPSNRALLEGASESA